MRLLEYCNIIGQRDRWVLTERSNLAMIALLFLRKAFGKKQPVYGKKIGRPQKRWMELVTEDIKKRKPEGWKKLISITDSLGEKTGGPLLIGINIESLKSREKWGENGLDYK